MAGSYERRITLYINGQEVRNDVKSIRGEMTKLVNEQARMIIGSKEYVAHAEKIKQLKGILSEHNQQVAAVGKSWSFKGLADGFNKYFGIITAGLASLTGIVMGFKQIVKSFNDFEERVDNLSALTGLAGESLDWLSKKAKELSTSTLEGGIRVTQSAQDIIDAFTKTGSARPELLKNKEALVDVTENAIILSNAAKTELQPAIEALTMVMNQYNVPASEARRIINAIAAGSKEGAGEIPYITTAFEKAGTVAADANIPIETLIATIETLAPRITQPEIAGRSLKGVLLDLQAGANDTNPAIVGMSTAFENLAKKNLTVTELTKMFGVENITTAKILINNVGELKKYETAVTGTNVAIEQAAINTDNNNAKLAQAKNRLNVMSIELGEKLAPALTISTNGLSYMIKGLSATISFFNEFKGVIIPAVTAIVSYGLAVKVAAMWEERNNAAKGAGLVLSKLKVFWHAAERGALLLTAAAQALLTGNIGRATAAMRVFNAVTKLNPYALIASLIIAAGTALVMYTRRLSEAEIAQKAVNDVNLEAKKSIVEEKIKLESLLDIAKNEKLSKEERLKAIRALNAISPQYLGNLTLESINTDNAKKSVDEYVESLLQKARVQAAQEKLAEIEKERLDQLASGEDKATSFWQKIGASMASNGDAMVYQRLLETQSTENATKANDIYLAKVKAVKDIIGQDAPAVPTGNSTGTENEIKAGQDLIKIKERELEAAKLVPATTAAEVAARNRKVEAIQNEINKLNELGTSKEGSADSDIAKKKLKALEAANDKEISLINKKHLEGKLSEDEYQNDLLKQELKFLSDKASIYKAGSKEYEDAMMQSLAKQVEAQKKVKDLILEAQKELTDAKIENLQEGLEKERAIEEARWQDEMQRLKEKLIVHDDLSEDEKKHNDIVNQTIQAKTEAHQKKLTDIIKGGEIQKLLELALLHDAKAQTDEEHYAAERETAQAQYQQEIKDANGNASKIAQAEKNLSQKLINIKLEELNKRQEIGNAIFSAGNELFGALVQLAGKESALGKAMFILQQANAVGQIIFNTAIANSKAVAAMPFTGGQPWVTINTISAAVSIASVLAQTIASFAGGGYTGDGGKYDEAGTVHKGEYVIPQEGVKNPNLLPVISSIESARKSNRLRTLDLREDVASGMWSYQPPMAPTGASSGVRSTEVMTVSDPETKALLQENARTNRELTEELQKMRKEGIKGVFNRFGKNSIAEEMKEISKFNSKVSKS